MLRSRMSWSLFPLTSEFFAQLEYFKAENNIKGFDNALKVIRMKWDSISNKIPYGLPEKLWNYFFATVVAPARENLSPSEMERRRKEAAEKRAYYERQKALKREREEEDFEAMSKSYSKVPMKKDQYLLITEFGEEGPFNAENIVKRL